MAKKKLKGKKKSKLLERVGLPKKADSLEKVELPKKSEPLIEPEVQEEAPIAESVDLPVVPDEDTLIELADLFKVFSDPTRLKILYFLMDGPRCVADISEAAGVSQSATSHQLRGMKQDRLITFKRNGKQVFYELANSGVQAMLVQGVSCIEE